MRFVTVRWDQALAVSAAVASCVVTSVVATPFLFVVRFDVVVDCASNFQKCGPRMAGLPVARSAVAISDLWISPLNPKPAAYTGARTDLQLQLGHADLAMTQIYASALSALWPGPRGRKGS